MSKEGRWMREQEKWMGKQLRRLENAESRRAEILRRQETTRLAAEAEAERARDEEQE